MIEIGIAIGVVVSLLASVICLAVVVRWRAVVKLNIVAHGKTANIMKQLKEVVDDNTDSARICRDILRRRIDDNY